MAKPSSRLSSDLLFLKLDQKKATAEMKKSLDNYMNLRLSTKNVYLVEFLNRKFIFALNREFAKDDGNNNSLLKRIHSRKGIFGMIMSYDNSANGYVSDKIVVSDPVSSDRVNLQILDLRGQPLYAGTGSIRKSGIDFTIKGLPSEGRVRTTISGTIGRTSISFSRSMMPNRIHKKVQVPHRGEQISDRTLSS